MKQKGSNEILSSEQKQGFLAGSADQFNNEFSANEKLKYRTPMNIPESNFEDFEEMDPTNERLVG